MGWVVSNYVVGGVTPAPHGNENTTSAPSGTFATANQPINIAANRDEQWDTLARHLGREDLLSNPLFLTRELRKTNRHALRGELESVLITQPANHWVKALNNLGVPTGPVLTVPQVLADPQLSERGMMSDIMIGNETLQIAAAPVIVDGSRPSADTPPPILGAHSSEVWAELGLSAAEIENLREEGVI